MRADSRDVRERKYKPLGSLGMRLVSAFPYIPAAAFGGPSNGRTLRGLRILRGKEKDSVRPLFPSFLL
jgi:hypothetical protein